MLSRIMKWVKRADAVISNYHLLITGGTGSFGNAVLNRRL